MDKNDEKKQLIGDYRNTFGSEEGKRVLANLKSGARYNVAMVPKGHDGHIDIHEMMRQEGKRSMIIHIETMLNKDPYEKKGIKHG
jgi:hypothetical protein